MAKRPVFSPLAKREHLVQETLVDFPWSPGFAASQKKKNVMALHEAAGASGLFPLLEVSSKSEFEMGRRLSAFSLMVPTELGDISVESAFQGSKIFEDDGPFTDIYMMDSLSAKRDERLKKSGNLIGFEFFGVKWPLEPKTAFYDWLYLTSLRPHKEYLKEKLSVFNGFTDIEFNPERSINCQARTCALLISLIKLDLFEQALRSQEDFIGIVSADSFKQSHSDDLKQGNLI
ncbi:hypothetical protein NFHSH190041_23300 [Shewanella sp. NFH-SH190041]|uniref:DarT1-associated NADAR antitoxin family protein n=1 Tax=Shewanella sp. NFH-SH190041 TaxID=2950245 RepID=UPI0021C34BEB|nr:hypothetical protein [Shewanella sp. NFH-SH190041]BDM64878.1 hypothetical protein NFHSH190041_23300 [Shewanella sp. NFH-SH190041]